MCLVLRWSTVSHTASNHELEEHFKWQEQLSNGFSIGRRWATTAVDNRHHVLQLRRDKRQIAEEIAKRMHRTTVRSISRFTVTKRLHKGNLFARWPVQCVPLTPAHRRRGSRNTRTGQFSNVVECSLRIRAAFACRAILDVYTRRESGKHETTPLLSSKGTCLEVWEFLFGELSR